MAALMSCGGGDIGGGVGEFTTVTASAAAKTPRFEADIVKDNTCSLTGSTGGTIETDSVDVNFTSTKLFPNNTLNLVISKITVHYTPINRVTTPDIPDYFLNTSQTVAPGTTTTITVPILTDAQKIDLLDRATLAMPVCSSTVFEYYVDIIFETSEPGGNGTVRNIVAKTNLAIADRL